MTAVDESPDLRVIGGFELTVGGEPVALAGNARRLLAYLAVHGHAQRRDTVAGQLWSTVPAEQARGTLRTALWRVNQSPGRLVHSGREELRLVPDVRVDLARSTRLARALLDPDGAVDLPGSPALFTDDILPGWDEDWLELERERHRQLRIHALEALSRRLTAAGRYAAAIDVAYRAIEAEALRESAHAALIRAHLAEGNQAAAAHQLDVYRRLLHDELGLRPSAHLEALVRPPPG